MNTKLYYTVYAVSILLLVVFSGRLAYLHHTGSSTEEKAIPVLLAYNGDQTNRSSAVYIGNGYFLTATHILEEDQEQLVMETSLEQKLVADLLWSSYSYDVSLLHSKDYDQADLDHYEINCDPIYLGQELKFVGYPVHLDFIHAWGRVASKSFEVPNMWHRVTPVNATIIPGMSGGAVVDEQGYLRGLNVGTHRASVGQTAMGPQASFTGISYIVEASDICFLMGK